MLIPLISILLSLVMALLAMAFYTLIERKLLGYSQLRKGPNKVIFMGLPQPMADAMKLLMKKQSILYFSNKWYFLASPMLSLMLALMMWSIYPHVTPSFWFQFNVLFFLCVSAMNVYATFLSGWSSNSKYALLGSLRSVAQTISYEISMSLILLNSLILMMSIDFTKFSLVTSIPIIMLNFPIAVMWYITNLAETNRAPFDFAEGESELVSGFNIEYGYSLFALIFMAEYCNILFMSLISSILFLTFWLKVLTIPLIISTMVLAIMFVWIRSSFPRMRYDLLMMLTWKCFLPFSLSIMLLMYMIL
uniref:NADH dehydrogenase subunit 1 n=1 Tax=Dinobdella ferox TaxID=755736 RepID=UPI0023D80306|nr:NADH dehydrogenase subunit 1 [Dinobdella ferox]WDA96082.1 NADH dehydrogenase subunit 1 [Dinobdella ferox]